MIATITELYQISLRKLAAKGPVYSVQTSTEGINVGDWLQPRPGLISELLIVHAPSFCSWWIIGWWPEETSVRVWGHVRICSLDCRGRIIAVIVYIDHGACCLWLRHLQQRIDCWRSVAYLVWELCITVAIKLLNCRQYWFCDVEDWKCGVRFLKGVLYSSGAQHWSIDDGRLVAEANDCVSDRHLRSFQLEWRMYTWFRSQFLDRGAWQYAALGYPWGFLAQLTFCEITGPRKLPTIVSNLEQEGEQTTRCLKSIHDVRNAYFVRYSRLLQGRDRATGIRVFILKLWKDWVNQAIS